MVCPMRDAGGIKNKLLEALAMGKATVATPEAADGIAARNGHEYVLAQGAEPFAASCLRLLRDDDECARLEQNARAWAVTRTWQETADRYIELYREAMDAAAVR
jgi:glycosyltransferase involved in cell wall biosynthesis